jgi:hypothetical protein
MFEEQWGALVEAYQDYQKWRPMEGMHYVISFSTSACIYIVKEFSQFSYSLVAPFAGTLMYFFAYLLNYLLADVSYLLGDVPTAKQIPAVQVAFLSFVGNTVGALLFLTIYKFAEDRGGFGH